MAKLKFTFRTLTHSPERLNVVSTKLGAVEKAGFKTATDVLKPMVLSATVPGAHEIAKDGEEIEGFLDNLDAGGTSDGFDFGGVARGNRGVRFHAEIVGEAKLKDLVVAAENATAGVANDSGLGKVKVGEPKLNLWRIIDIAGGKETAAGGEIVTLELL